MIQDILKPKSNEELANHIKDLTGIYPENDDLEYVLKLLNIAIFQFVDDKIVKYSYVKPLFVRTHLHSLYGSLTFNIDSTIIKVNKKFISFKSIYEEIIDKIKKHSIKDNKHILRKYDSNNSIYAYAANIIAKKSRIGFANFIIGNNKKLENFKIPNIKVIYDNNINDTVIVSRKANTLSELGIKIFFHKNCYKIFLKHSKNLYFCFNNK